MKGTPKTLVILLLPLLIACGVKESPMGPCFGSHLVGEWSNSSNEISFDHTCHGFMNGSEFRYEDDSIGAGYVALHFETSGTTCAYNIDDNVLELNCTGSAEIFNRY